MKIKSILKRIYFSIVLKTYIHEEANTVYGYRGRFKTWKDAKNLSSGYDSSLILSKVAQSTLDVLNGKASYERDGVTFHRPEYSHRLLFALMYIKNEESKLSVIDFGGSLGSTYFQNKIFIDKISDSKWAIVEQECFEKLAREIKVDSYIDYYSRIEDAFRIVKPNCLIMSGVLPYLENDLEILDNLLMHKPKYIYLDRTATINLSEDIISIHYVPPSIYDASYPVRLLSYPSLVKRLEQNYSVIFEFKSEIDDDFIFEGIRVQHLGLFLKLK